MVILACSRKPVHSPLSLAILSNIVVSFTPQRKGRTEGVLSISSDSKTRPKREVHLSGEGVDCWDIRHCVPKSYEFGATLLVALLYWFGMVVVRWNRVARPTRRLLEAQIDSSLAELKALPKAQPNSPDPGVERIENLFVTAKNLIAQSSWRNGDFFFWSRGQEITGWGYVHEAEIQMARLLEEETVKARLETVQEELTATNTTNSLALANRIQQALTGTPAASPIRCQALLAEALNANYERTDTSFAELVSWQNKTAWLVAVGLMLIVALSAALGHAVLFLVGGTGGLLSRLSRSLERKDVPTDYGVFLDHTISQPGGGCLGRLDRHIAGYIGDQGWSAGKSLQRELGLSV